MAGLADIHIDPITGIVQEIPLAIDSTGFHLLNNYTFDTPDRIINGSTNPTLPATFNATTAISLYPGLGTQTESDTEYSGLLGTYTTSGGNAGSWVPSTPGIYNMNLSISLTGLPATTTGVVSCFLSAAVETSMGCRTQAFQTTAGGPNITTATLSFDLQFLGNPLSSYYFALFTTASTGAISAWRVYITRSS